MKSRKQLSNVPASAKCMERLQECHDTMEVVLRGVKLLMFDPSTKSVSYKNETCKLYCKLLLRHTAAMEDVQIKPCSKVLLTMDAEASGVQAISMLEASNPMYSTVKVRTKSLDSSQ